MKKDKVVYSLFFDTQSECQLPQCLALQICDWINFHCIILLQTLKSDRFSCVLSRSVTESIFTAPFFFKLWKVTGFLVYITFNSPKWCRYIYVCMYVCMYVRTTQCYKPVQIDIYYNYSHISGTLSAHRELNWTTCPICPCTHACTHARTHTHTHIHTSVHAYTVMSYLAVSEQSAGEAQQLSFTHGEVLPILLHHRVQLIVQRLDLSAIREEQSPHMHHKVTHFNLSFHPVIDLHYTGTKSVITRTSQSDRS